MRRNHSGAESQCRPKVVDDVRRAHGQRERSARLVPVGALEDPRLAPSQRPPVSSMSSRLGAKTSKTKRPPGSSSAPAARSARSFGFGFHGAMSGETGRWRGARARRRAARGGRRVGDRRAPRRRPTPRRRARLEHLRRRVDADHPDPGFGDRDRDPSRSDRELDDRAARRDRVIDVVRDVFRHRAAPRVVERRDLVVLSHAAFGRPRRTRGSRRRMGGGRTSRTTPPSPGPTRPVGLPIRARDHQAEIPPPSASAMSIRLSAGA